MTEKRIKGLKLSSGIAFGVPFILKPVAHKPQDILLEKNEVSQEIERYKSALEQSRKDLRYLQKRSSGEGKNAVAQILEAHLEILKDPLITEIIVARISKLQKNTEVIFQQFLAEYENNFRKKDQFFKERMNDIQDVAGRILSHLYPRFKDNNNLIFKEAVIFSKELIPSLALELAQKKCVAFVTEKGCTTSHTAIIARAKGIPFVSGINLEALKQPLKQVIVDGQKGEVIINPTASTIKLYCKKEQALKTAAVSNVLSGSVNTLDQKKVSLFANVEDDAKLDGDKIAGIGLFRSEYLCLKAGCFPSEEQQLRVYRNLLLQMQNKPVVIRLFDIGSDKSLKSKGNMGFMPKEENPALGFRAIRFLLKNTQILKEQIRALLKASIFGNLHILVPLISDLGELLKVKKIILEVAEELNKEGLEVKKNLPIGSMIEVPSAALMCHEIAKESDFLSIGTNDLTQYLMAADRSNQEVRHFYDFASPSLIYLLDRISKAAKQAQKPLFICGEMAADPKFTELLIGLGIERFSLSKTLFTPVQKQIQKTNSKKAKKLLKKALNCSSLEEMRSLLFNDAVQLDRCKM